MAGVGADPGRKLLLLAEFSVLTTLVNSRRKEHILSVIGEYCFCSVVLLVTYCLSGLNLPLFFLLCPIGVGTCEHFS